MDHPDKRVKFLVRFPLRLKEQVADAAKYYRRSMNSEIVARLEQSFSGSITPRVNDQDLLRANDGNSQLDTFLRHTLSSDEVTLVRSFRRLNESKRRALMDLLN